MNWLGKLFNKKSSFEIFDLFELLVRDVLCNHILILIENFLEAQQDFMQKKQLNVRSQILFTWNYF